MRLNKAAAVLSLCMIAGSAYAAAPDTSKGTWFADLKGRDASGNAVSLLDGLGNANPLLKFVWDSKNDVTWLADWNGASSKTWADANTWATGLGDFGLSWTQPASVWALPSVTDLNDDDNYFAGCDLNPGGDCGYNPYTPSTRAANSLLAYMYYDVLGNTPPVVGSPSVPDPNGGLKNTGPFMNVGLHAYWSSTSFEPDSSRAWAVDFAGGFQSPDGKGEFLRYVAVRPGDVQPIPEPGSVVLMLAGLAGLGAVYRRRRN